MLIISKFKDYYDGVVQTTGIDKTIVYDRYLHVEDLESRGKRQIEVPKIFEKTNWYFDNPIRNLNNFNQFYKKGVTDIAKYSFFVVGFCGKSYIGFRIFKTNPEYCAHIVNSGDEKIEIITYDINDVIDAVPRLSNSKESIKFKNAYDQLKREINTLEIHRKYNVPIFAFDYFYPIDTYKSSKCFVLNPNLKNFEFYKIMDAFTTLQEIQMFISGVLGNKEKETIQVSDKSKIEGHGFDYKWSFRKEPNK